MIGIQWSYELLEIVAENWDEAGDPPAVADAGGSTGAVIYVLVSKSFAQIGSVNWTP